MSHLFGVLCSLLLTLINFGFIHTLICNTRQPKSWAISKGNFGCNLHFYLILTRFSIRTGSCFQNIAERGWFNAFNTGFKSGLCDGRLLSQLKSQKPKVFWRLSGKGIITDISRFTVIHTIWWINLRIYKRDKLPNVCKSKSTLTKAELR